MPAIAASTSSPGIPSQVNAAVLDLLDVLNTVEPLRTLDPGMVARVEGWERQIAKYGDDADLSGTQMLLVNRAVLNLSRAVDQTREKEARRG